MIEKYESFKFDLSTIKAGLDDDEDKRASSLL